MSKPQLFCFTYAGGTAAFFDTIEKDLPDFDLVKFEYSGHGTRRKEPFYRNFDELAEDIYKQLIASYTNVEYALFGYSMGSIAVVEVLRRLKEKSEIKMPSRVFLAAHEPQSKIELVGYTDKELDERVKERTIRFGAVPDRLVDNDSFWRVYLPLYRADYSIIQKYDFEKLDLKSSIPVTVFYSETDTPMAEMSLWKRFFVGECDFCRYDGTHFFIYEHHVELAQVIRDKMCN